MSLVKLSCLDIPAMLGSGLFLGDLAISQVDSDCKDCKRVREKHFAPLLLFKVLESMSDKAFAFSERDHVYW